MAAPEYGEKVWRQFGRLDMGEKELRIASESQRGGRPNKRPGKKGTKTAKLRGWRVTKAWPHSGRRLRNLKRGEAC
jgi:hypothetical protein